MASELPEAFDHGVSFDASAVDGFMNIEESDLLLVPGITRHVGHLAVAPAAGARGAVFIAIFRIRTALRFWETGGIRAGKRRCQRRRKWAISAKSSAECEVYLFELDEEGEPTEIPQDKAGYLDVAPLDKGENVRREICLNMEQMGLAPESSHREKGAGRNEDRI